MNIRKYLFIVFIVSFASTISAQSTHSSLKDPELLKKFRTISDQIICSCGCNMPLDYCNHVNHCNGWPMRMVIERLLLDGKDEKFIVNGFVHGFGEMVYTHRAFELARSKDYEYLVDNFVNGFGEEYLTEPPNHNPEYLIPVIALIVGGIAGLFLRTHFRKLNKKKTETNTNQNPISAEKEALYSRLYEEDKE